MGFQPESEQHPLAAVFGADRTALDTSGHYVVLPTVAVERLLPHQQHQLAELVTAVQCVPGPWPTYRVQPLRPAPVAELGPDQLSQAGIDIELDDQGQLGYRELSTGSPITALEQYSVLVPTSDPLFPPR